LSEKNGFLKLLFQVIGAKNIILWRRIMKKNSKLVTILVVMMILFVMGSIKSFAAANQEKTSGADSYPNRTITFIFPWAVGGSADNGARVLAALMSEDLGQNVVVVNKEGGGSAVGLRELAASPNDGYTIGLATSSLTLMPYLGMPNAPSQKSLAPLSRIYTSPACIGVRADSKFNSLSEFIAYAKDNPNKILLGDNGATNIWRIFSMRFASLAGILLTYVPFNGPSESAPALLGGHIDAIAVSSSALANHVASGDIKYLGIASDKKDPFFPAVPTFKEQGLNFSFELWWGLFAPQGTDPAIVQKLSDSIKRCLEKKPHKEFLVNNGLTEAYMNHTDFLALLDEQDELIAGLAREAGMGSR
jgi:tripartite-type tricarboxylate transporter receptor subunit TctC